MQCPGDANICTCFPSIASTMFGKFHFASKSLAIGFQAEGVLIKPASLSLSHKALQVSFISSNSCGAHSVWLQVEQASPVAKYLSVTKSL